MRRQPILPTKKEQAWSETASSYRQSLHEDLYPKNQPWTPVTSGLTGTIEAGYTSIGPVSVFGLSIDGPTTSSAGYIDLPFTVSQSSVFGVSVDGAAKAATINKGASRLYLPDWSGAGRVLISGVVVS